MVHSRTKIWEQGYTFPRRTEYQDGLINRMLLKNRKELLVENTGEDPIVGSLMFANGIDEACKLARTIFFAELNIGS